MQEDFIKAFDDLGGKVDINNTSVFDREQTSLTDIDAEIDNIISNQIKTVVLIPSVKTNSIVRAFARASQEKTKKLNIENLNIIFAMCVFEEPTLDIGGDAVEGASLAAPCVKKTSLYMKGAIKRWQQKNLFCLEPEYHSHYQIAPKNFHHSTFDAYYYFQLLRSCTKEEIT